MIDVPFAFKYFNMEMPAGRYKFSYSNSPSAVFLTNVETRNAIQVAVRPGRSLQPLKLVFDQQGDIHVLRSVK